MKNFYTLICFLFLLNFSLIAEELTTDQKRRINLSVLRLIEKYEIYSTFVGVNNADKFFSLFTETASIYNDYLPFNAKQKVTPKEYYTIVQNEQSRSKISVEISNVVIESKLNQLENNQFIAKVRLDKNVFFRNWNNFRYPDRTFKMNIEVLITSSATKIEAKISNISTDTPVKQFSVISAQLQNTDLQAEPIKYIKKVIQFEEKENEAIAFIEGTKNPGNSLIIDSYDAYLEIKPDSSLRPDKNVFYLNIKEYNYDIGFKSHVNSLNSFNMSSNKPLTVKDIYFYSYSYGFGIDFNKKITKIGRVNYFLNSGLGYEYNEIMFSGNYTNEGFEYKAKDSDNDDYLRQVKVNGIEESVSLQYLTLPVGGKVVYFLANKYSLEATLGIKLYYLFSGFSDVTAQSVEYKGFYEQYDNLWMEHYYDFGKFNNGENNVRLKAKNYTDLLSSLNIGMYASVGANYRINRNISLALNLGFDHTFINISPNLRSYTISNNYQNDVFDYSSLIYAYNAIVKSNIFINLGLNYKF